MKNEYSHELNDDSACIYVNDSDVFSFDIQSVTFCCGIKEIGNIYCDYLNVPKSKAFEKELDALLHTLVRKTDNRDTAKQIAEMARISDIFSMKWQDWIIKYQKEIGYNAPNGFDKGYVNNY